ncbi:MAG: 1,4-dihydroxy-2-naphthoate polyprenyltransferase [Acidimicrobiia bacterium]
MSSPAVLPGSVAAWVLAARPRTLWAAIAPVLVGAALAADDGAWRPGVFLVVAASALAIQIGVNFANDVADAARGADTADRVGPPRAAAEGLLTSRQLWAGVAFSFGLATVGGALLVWVAGPVVVAIGLASIAAALGYTNGPVPYGYHGLGELFVFVFFGPVATVGTRFVFDRSTTAAAWGGGVAMGLLAAAILVANNYRDIDTDGAAGKRTLAVRLGRRRTVTLYAVTLLGGVVAGPVFAAFGVLPSGSLVALAALPPAVRLIGRLRGGKGAELVPVLENTARLQLLTAVLLVVGIAAI